ncbi:MAG: lipase maturation factor family protein, partial [Opitutaceae bacterium]|nr:lipase maturation factor family protein [Opitutaceae bacterium]
KFSGPLLSATWRRMKDFAGLDNDATYLWPRWLILRAVGLVFMVIFAGIIHESRALIGPDGLAPLPSLLAQLKAAHPSLFTAFLAAPSLFWINSSWSMTVAVQWLGMAAAVSLVFNLWPRLSLLVCWAALLSFARGWVVFSDPQVDWLMLEVALLCIPFAPAGYRPGLGAHSPVRPIALFMVRWLLFRVMLESGVAKLLSGEVRWLDLTAMDALYETAPCPTILGYLDHQLPHWWHVGELGLTFAAEILAPLLALLAGRRGRWIAFWLWAALQAGIQLTCNFGWLNTSSLALGLVLLDDQMLAAAAQTLRLPRFGRFLAARAVRLTPPRLARWRHVSLRVALWTHFYLTLVAFGLIAGVPNTPIANFFTAPLERVFKGFGSVNAYQLYAKLDPFHCVVEFVGSNDGGLTWRPYEFRYFPQQLDRICPFIAPYFPRFEATMQIQVITRDKPTVLYELVAKQLLLQNPAVLRLFAHNPFPDGGPQMIRTPGYRYTFTDLATYHRDRLYWQRSYLGEYLPLLHLASDGSVVQAVTTYEQLLIKAQCGNAVAQSYLAFLFISGEEGVDQDPVEARHWFERAAAQGLADAQFNLALIYAKGDGVPADPRQAAHWCRLAAEQGLPAAADRLGVMYIKGEGVAQDEVAALAWFQLAALGGDAEGKAHWDYTRTRAQPAVLEAAAQRARAIQAGIAARKSAASNP